MSAHEAGRRADPREVEGLGAVYTPAWVVDRILAEVLRRVDFATATVCDPTCGDGSFLRGAQRAGVSEDRLFGVDRDTAAVELARAALPGAHLACGEALLGIDWGEDRFDAVVGNPPFVRIQHLREHDSVLADALPGRYASAAKNFDLYGPVLELALRLTRRVAAFVLPHRFFKTEYGEALRRLLAPHVAAIVDFGDRQVFGGVATYVCILVLEKRVRKTFSYAREWEVGQERVKNLDSKCLAPQSWIPLFRDEQRALEKLNAGAIPLFGQPDSPAKKLFVGLQTPSNRIYRLTKLEDRDDRLLVTSSAETEPFEIEAWITRPLLMGADVGAYRVRGGQLLLHPYRGKALVDLPAEAPLAAAYVGRHRESFTAGKAWWAFRYPKNLEAFEQPKLLVGGIAPRGRYAYDEKGKYFVVGGGDGGYSLIPRAGVDPWALLGLLGSAPLDFHLQRHSSMFAGHCYSYGRRFLQGLPIRGAALMPELGDLARKRAGARDTEAVTLDRRIDAFVAEAYGLDNRDMAAIARLVPPRKPSGP